MRFTLERFRGWRKGVPHCLAGLLACALAADLAQLASTLRQAQSGPIAVPTSVPPSRRIDVPGILRAHLFGTDASTAAMARELEARPALALAGTVATADPREGYAMLGETGKPTRLYRAGADLDRALGGRLAQVFTDRVVLDFDGVRATLRLTKAVSSGAGGPPIDAPAPLVAEDEPVKHAVPDTPMQPVTAIQSWFAGLDPELTATDGEPGSVLLHPSKHFQRQYGLRDGDELTAVNGVEVTDAGTLEGALKSGGDSVRLTLTRDGMEQTLTVAVPD